MDLDAQLARRGLNPLPLLAALRLQLGADTRQRDHGHVDVTHRADMAYDVGASAGAPERREYNP